MKWWLAVELIKDLDGDRKLHVFHELGTLFHIEQLLREMQLQEK